MILVYLEHVGKKFSKGTLCAIGAALQAKEMHGIAPVVGVVIGGEGSAEAAKELAAYGLEEVICVENPSFEKYLAGSYGEVLKKICEERAPAMVVALSSTQGKDLMPRVAQALDAGQVSECLEFLPNKRYRRPMFAGNLLAEVEVHSATSVVTVRGSAFDAALRQEKTAEVRMRSDLSVSVSGSEFVRFDTIQSERPELTEAEVIVSGGRALKSAESFNSLLTPLADAFGGAIGASRAAVDSGYAPNDWQVGQTGKVVAPKLYIAVGISGAIQHLAGMKDSKVIVAINKDPDAPIFEVADYGLVADLFEAVPQLTEGVKKIRSGA